ncbi:hypothetical protein [Afifella sp. IM 167]|uniref:hypothetical protein n=1 Tax=Afifella sp. IM 167 TaxID=2033586 RepID=UPI001CCB84EB|nr:hypothetical protein [Afifella sp. IM 167]
MRESDKYEDQVQLLPGRSPAAKPAEAPSPVHMTLADAVRTVCEKLPEERRPTSRIVCVDGYIIFGDEIGGIYLREDFPRQGAK